jgi:hypothetical protein
MSLLLGEATSWSELPAALDAYNTLVDKEGGGVSRLFGYASLIKDHDNEKPQTSGGLPDERARLPGMEVAMNVLAAGEYEFRGTRATYTDATGTKKPFANVGLYAGLERASSKDGYAQGMNITATPADRRSSLAAYIKRELGDPPAGVMPDDLFDKTATPKFKALEGNPQDKFGMYKFQIVYVEVQTEEGVKQVPAVTVSTNEKGRFSAIGLTPVQAAAMILDGQGYVRTEGQSSRGGTALDYFKNNVIGVARELRLHQPRLEAIDGAIETLGRIGQEMHDILALHLPKLQEDALIYASTYAHRKEEKGIYSPLFRDGENVNNRAPVGDEERARPENVMPHSADEKFARIAQLHDEGKTGRSR